MAKHKNIKSKDNVSSDKSKVQRERTRLYQSVEETKSNESKESSEVSKSKDLEAKKIRAIPKTREERALDEIKDHVILSMGIGAVPIFILDLIALVGIQLRLLKRMAKIYGQLQHFNETQGKSIIGSLMGGLGFFLAAANIGPSFIKLFPGIGPIIGAASMPVFSGASTYALGKVFIIHFDSGGTFLNFCPEEMKRYYAEQLGLGKKFASRIKNNRT